MKKVGYMKKDIKYKCECGMYVATKKTDGYIAVNSKCKNMSANGEVVKFTCVCKKQFTIEVDK